MTHNNDEAMQCIERPCETPADMHLYTYRAELVNIQSPDSMKPDLTGLLHARSDLQLTA